MAVTFASPLFTDMNQTHDGNAKHEASHQKGIHQAKINFFSEYEARDLGQESAARGANGGTWCAERAL